MQKSYFSQSLLHSFLSLTQVIFLPDLRGRSKASNANSGDGRWTLALESLHSMKRTAFAQFNLSEAGQWHLKSTNSCTLLGPGLKHHSIFLTCSRSMAFEHHKSLSLRKRPSLTSFNLSQETGHIAREGTVGQNLCPDVMVPAKKNGLIWGFRNWFQK